MRNKIQFIMVITIFALSLSAAMAQIKLGPTKTTGGVYPKPETYQSTGNMISGMIKVYKGHISCLDLAQVASALQVTAKELSAENSKVGRVEIGALRDAGEFYECPYKITRLPSDQKIKINLAFRAAKCTASVSAYVFERKKQVVNRGESDWDSSINFPSQSMTGKLAATYNFNVFAKILQ